MSEKNLLQEYCQKNGLIMPQYETWSRGEAHRLEWFAQVKVVVNGRTLLVESDKWANSKTNAEKIAAKAMLYHLDENYKKIFTPSINMEFEKFYTSKNIVPNSSKIQPHIIDFLKSDKFEPIVSNPEKKRLIEEFRKFNVLSIESIDTIHVIDAENKQFFKLNPNPNAMYIAFINSIHNTLPKYTEWHICKSDDITAEINSCANSRLLYMIEGGTTDLVDHFMSCFAYAIVEFIKKNSITPIINIVSGDHAGWCTRICIEKVAKWKGINVNVKNSISLN